MFEKEPAFKVPTEEEIAAFRKHIIPMTPEQKELDRAIYKQMRKVSELKRKTTGIGRLVNITRLDSLRQELIQEETKLRQMEHDEKLLIKKIEEQATIERYKSYNGRRL